MRSRRSVAAALVLSLLVAGASVGRVAAEAADAGQAKSEPAASGRRSVASSPEASEELARLRAEVLRLRRALELQGRVGIFELARVLADSRKGRELEEELNRFRVERQAEIRRLDEELLRLGVRLEERRSLLSATEREAMEADILERRVQLGRLARDAEDELGRLKQQGLEGIGRAVDRAVAELAEREGYGLILQRELCEFASPVLDVTEALVALMDRGS